MNKEIFKIAKCSHTLCGITHAAVVSGTSSHYDHTLSTKMGYKILH